MAGNGSSSNVTNNGGDITFPDSMNPRSQQYTPAVTREAFGGVFIGNTRFEAWVRMFFGPNDRRCVRCYVERFRCEPPPGVGPCHYCREHDERCEMVSRPDTIQPGQRIPFHEVVTWQYQAVPESAEVPVPAAPPFLPAPTMAPRKCGYCIQREYRHCDARHDLGVGCSLCRALDQPCKIRRWGGDLVARPDVLTMPLCCDNCFFRAGNIKGCSWRAGENNRGLDAGPCTQCEDQGLECTYGGRNRVDLAPGGSERAHATHFERTRRLPPNPRRPERLVEATSNISLSLPTLQEVQAAAQTGESRSQFCEGCNAHGALPKKCGAAPKTDDHPGQGCEECVRWGLVCILQGRVLPTHPTAKVTGARGNWTTCEPCKANGWPCDRQRPCDSCVQHGVDEALCSISPGTTKRPRGLIRRGAPGTDMRCYYLAMGYASPTDKSKVSVQRQPSDYHEEYIMSHPEVDPASFRELQERRRAQAGPSHQTQPQHDPNVPLPSIEELTLEDEQWILQNMHVLEQGLFEPDEIAESEEEAQRQGEWNDAYAAIADEWHRGIKMNAAEIRKSLRASIERGESPSNSEVLQDLQREMVRQSGDLNYEGQAEIPITIPESAPDHDWSQNWLNWLNPLEQPIRNASVLAYHDVTPGPLQPLYNPRAGEAPSEDPLFRAHPPEHPNPLAIPALESIPFMRPLIDGLLPGTDPQLCGEIVLPQSGQCHRCFQNTTGICEDVTHTQRAYVCDACNEASKRRFVRRWLLDDFWMAMRAYACATCADVNAPRPETYAGTGHHVWGFSAEETDAAAGAVASPRAPKTRPPFVHAEPAGGWQGPDPRPVTGCLCADKFFGRRLCAPHRTQRMADLETAVAALQAYVVARYGRGTWRVCPWCRARASTSLAGFRGRRGAGGTGGPQAYACLACHDLVVNQGVSATMIIAGGSRWGFPEPKAVAVVEVPDDPEDMGMDEDEDGGSGGQGRDKGKGKAIQGAPLEFTTEDFVVHMEID
ncbi:hypothetical protein F4780DRAFT_796644 [Xylariomycetidae sp. FL0641]|nr:hypothetical protein F4780DRAFT_796644 [Xylariomycetidae sp. FL0641]